MSCSHRCDDVRDNKAAKQESSDKKACVDWPDFFEMYVHSSPLEREIKCPAWVSRDRRNMSERQAHEQLYLQKWPETERDLEGGVTGN